MFLICPSVALDGSPKRESYTDFLHQIAGVSVEMKRDDVREEGNMVSSGQQ
jgi:hypothetical protein